MTNEQKLLQAAKFALASIKKNKPHTDLPLTEQMLERAIRNYGEEHVKEIDLDVALQQHHTRNMQVLVDSLG